MHTRWLVVCFTSLILLAPRLYGKSASKTQPVINTAFRLEIQFPPGGSEIKPAYDKDIRRIVDYMNNYPYTKCDIRGFTDNVGSDAINLKLSQQRAESVRRYMIEKLGIASNRVLAHGYGENEPAASNRTPKGRQLNRRIIAILTGQPPT